jgi:hypothetical protein
LPLLIGVNGPFLLDDFANLPFAKAASESIDVFLQSIFANGSGPLRRPISNSSFTLNYFLFGSNPASFKAVNIAIHLLNSLLIFELCRNVLGLIKPDAKADKIYAISLLTCFIWAAHPIQVSTVLYVVQRMTLLSTLFMLCSLLLSISILKSQKTHIAKVKLFLMAIFLALSILSKEITVIFPLLVICILVHVDQAEMANFRAIKYKQSLILSVFIIAILGIAFGLFTLPKIIDSYGGRDFTFYQRITTEPRILADYLINIFSFNSRKMGLYLDSYQPRDVLNPLTWTPLAALLIGAVAIFAKRRKFPVVSFCIFWFLAAHALESTIFPLELAFEHRNYLALFGPALLLSSAIIGLGRTIKPSLQILVIGAFVLMTLGLTSVRAHQWSRIDLFVRGELNNHPNSKRALAHAITFDMELGNNNQAIRTIEYAQSIYHDSFFFKSYDLHLSCTSRDVKVDWKEQLNLLMNDPLQKDSSLTLRLLVNKVADGSCKYIDKIQLLDLLESAALHYRSSGNPYQAEQMFVLASRISEINGDINKSMRLLKSGYLANHQGDIALLELAYLQLNNNFIDEAQQTLNILKRRNLTMDADLSDLSNFILEKRSTDSKVY